MCFDAHPNGLDWQPQSGALWTTEVIFVSFADGRPVGVAVDGAGALLVANDVGNVIWRVTPAASNR